MEGGQRQIDIAMLGCSRSDGESRAIIMFDAYAMGPVSDALADW